MHSIVRFVMPRVVTLVLIIAGLGACREQSAGLPPVGTLARDRIELTAEAHEPVIEIRVREGNAVASGDVLLRLDPLQSEAELARVQAAKVRAEQRLAELIRGPRQETILEAQAMLRGAEAGLVNARAEYVRVKALVGDQLISRAELDRAKAALDRAVASRDEARAKLAALLEGTTVEALEQARATVAEASAAVEHAALSHDRLTVRAPVAGIIDVLPFEVGERPPLGAVVAVLLSGNAYARVYLPALVRPQVKPGLAATVHVDGLNEAVAGRVRFVSSEAAFTPYFALTERDRSRLNYLAEIDLVDDQAHNLPAGVPVEVDFQSIGDATP